MVVGSLGKMVFRSGRDVVRTLDNFKWSGSSGVAVHDRHLGVGLAEWTGKGADEISFDVFLSADLGIDPQVELKRVRGYAKTGEALTLVLGNKVYGYNKWVVESYDYDVQHWFGNGLVRSAKLSLKLREYVN